MKLTRNILPTLAISAGLAGAVFYTSGCSDDFLEIEPRGVLTSDLLGTPAGINQLLVGTYSQLSGTGGFYSGATNWLHGSVRGGDALKGSTPGDQPAANPVQRHEVTPTNSVIAEKWRESFDGVARANLALRTIRDAIENGNPGVADNEAFAKSAEGQALFLRSHFYFELAKNYNRVPYITEDVTFEETASVSNAVIWENIEADFARAVELLPERQDVIGKANKWAAKAYLGKTQLYRNKYAEAQATLEDVIANGTNSAGVKFGLFDKYSDAFNGDLDNGKEAVFAVQAAANTGSINNANPELVLNYPNGGGPTGCCGFAQPSFDLVFSFRVNDAGLPLLDGSYRAAANRIVTDFGIGAGLNYVDTATYKKGDLISISDPASPRTERVYRVNRETARGINPLTGTSSDFELVYTEEGGKVDPRLDHSVGRRGLPYLDWGNHPGNPWIRDRDNGGPFAPKKTIFYKSQLGTLTDGSSWTSGYTAINVNVIRFADVLLMAAEAHIENAGGDLERARALINQVRRRAANPAGFVKEADGTNAANYSISEYGSGLSREQLRQGLRFERKLELSGEGHRMYDLVRWGVAAEVINSYLAFESSLLSGPLAGATFDAGKDEYYPIPQTQIDLSGGTLTQNPGY